MNKLSSILILPILFHFSLAAQPLCLNDSPGHRSNAGQIPGTIEKQAAFKGGMEALIFYLEDEMNYPREAREAAIEGLVKVRFEIDENGLPQNIRIASSLGFGCDEEAIRLIKHMPAWLPAKKQGSAVKTTVILPIYFTAL